MSLEGRVAILENQVNLLLQLVDSEKAPFAYHMLEVGATKEQVTRTFDLMDDYWQFIKRDEEVRSHREFERSVYDIFPDRHGDYHFAEGIVQTLARGNRYREVYDYMLKNGMNLGPLPEDG